MSTNLTISGLRNANTGYAITLTARQVLSKVLFEEYCPSKE